MNNNKVGFFRFRELPDRKYLLTNDFGEYVILAEKDFTRYLQGKISKDSSVYEILQSQGLVKDNTDFTDLISYYRKKNSYLWNGPTLHIIVVTLRCNHKCVYCQTSSIAEGKKGYDLDKKTAKNIVDMIWQSPAKSIAIEFQGGEPLLNWPVVKFIIEYANGKKRKAKKDVEFRLVSNFSLMDREKIGFLAKNNISLCTSLDGPAKLHNRNRIWLGGDSYETVTTWLKKARKIYDRKFKPAALTTISRESLKYPKEIVDEYIKLGMEGIFLRPLSRLGFAKNLWEKIGYSLDEFVQFYKKALDYIIDYNLKHPQRSFHENYARILLTKILTDSDPAFTELRSPCGAGIGQMLYNYNGDIYTCDEGRMLGDKTFCLGNVNTNQFQDLILNPIVKKVCLASELDGLACDLCVYKPYCGVCPVCSFAATGSIFSGPNNEKCRMNKAIFDFIFAKIRKNETRKIFEKWIKPNHK